MTAVVGEHGYEALSRPAVLERGLRTAVDRH
jgi:hypothetical protein